MTTKIEKRVINEANVYRHFKSTQKIIDEPIPAWVKKAQAGFKSPESHIPKDITWAKKTILVPGVPGRRRAKK